MEWQVPVENRARLPDADFLRLAGELTAQRSIKQTLDWLLGQTPPLELTDMLTQDEFSHDFLVSYPGGLWLVYDSS